MIFHASVMVFFGIFVNRLSLYYFMDSVLYAACQNLGGSTRDGAIAQFKHGGYSLVGESSRLKNLFLDF